MGTRAHPMVDQLPTIHLLWQTSYLGGHRTSDTEPWGSEKGEEGLLHPLQPDIKMYQEFIICTFIRIFILPPTCQDTHPPIS